MKVINIKIPESDNNMLDNLAGDKPGAKSALVREAVHQYCANKSTEQKRKNVVIDQVLEFSKMLLLMQKSTDKNFPRGCYDKSCTSFRYEYNN